MQKLHIFVITIIILLNKVNHMKFSFKGKMHLGVNWGGGGGGTNLVNLSSVWKGRFDFSVKISQEIMSFFQTI